MRINLSELREFLEAILLPLERSGRSHFECDNDYYWHVPFGSWSNPTEEPKELTIGQVSDDLRELRGIVAKTSTENLYAAVWLSSLLRVLGESELSHPPPVESAAKVEE